MLDEIKLNNGISYTCSLSQIKYFIPERSNTKKLYQQTLNESVEPKTTKKVTVYTNQLIFRLTYNLVHNTDFFSNNRSLDGNELIRQIMQVVLLYEFIGVKHYDIVSDAGGRNTKIFKLLQGNNLVEGP